MHLRGRQKRRYGHDSVWQTLTPMTTGAAAAADGTMLRWQRFDPPRTRGTGESTRLPVVFANGIGVRYPGLAVQIAHLRERHPIVTWDYRGAGDSLLPRPDTDVRIETHAEDLLTVLDALDIGPFVLVGWSMGVQVGLEVIRRRPEAVRGFAALFGTYGRPFRTGTLGPVAPAVDALLRVLVAVPLPSALMTKLGAFLPELALPFLERIRFVSPRAERPVFLSNVQDVADADHCAYLRTLLCLSEHDAFDVLAQVPCPALVVTGEHDYLTPPSVARAMAAQIPDAECVLLPETSHFGLIEPPRAVDPLLDRLLLRVAARTDRARAVSDGEGRQAPSVSS